MYKCTATATALDKQFIKLKIKKGVITPHKQIMYKR